MWSILTTLLAQPIVFFVFTFLVWKHFTATYKSPTLPPVNSYGRNFGNRKRTPLPPKQALPYRMLEHIVRLIMNDYVRSWHSTFTDRRPAVGSSFYGDFTSTAAVNESNHEDYNFANLAERRLESAIFGLYERTLTLDPSSVVLHLLPILTRHLSEYKRAVHTLSQSGTRQLTVTDELELTLASIYGSSSPLHPALSGMSVDGKRKASSNITLPLQTTDHELVYLRSLIDQCMPHLFPKSISDSALVSSLLREMLVGTVLQPALSLLSDPDYWNQLLDYYLDIAIKEQRMATKLREALEQPFKEETFQATSAHRSNKPPTFEVYLKEIKNTKNLLDAKRIRNHLMTEIRRTRLFARDPELQPNERDEARKYINRLFVAKKRIEKRILQLGGHLEIDPLSTNSAQSGSKSPRLSSDLKSFDTVGENNNSQLMDRLLQEPGIIVFREFMDTVLGGRGILQFYVTVSSIQKAFSDSFLASPVLDVNGSAIPDSREEKINLDGALMKRRLSENADLYKTLAGDVDNIYHVWFSDAAAAAEASLPFEKDFVQEVRYAFERWNVTGKAIEDLIHCVMMLWMAKDIVFRHMEENLLPKFTSSQYYYTYLTDSSHGVQSSTAARSLPSSPSLLSTSSTGFSFKKPNFLGVFKKRASATTMKPLATGFLSNLTDALTGGHSRSTSQLSARSPDSEQVTPKSSPVPIPISRKSPNPTARSSRADFRSPNSIDSQDFLSGNTTSPLSDVQAHFESTPTAHDNLSTDSLQTSEQQKPYPSGLFTMTGPNDFEAAGSNLGDVSGNEDASETENDEDEVEPSSSHDNLVGIGSDLFDSLKGPESDSSPEGARMYAIDDQLKATRKQRDLLDSMTSQMIETNNSTDDQQVQKKVIERMKNELDQEVSQLLAEKMTIQLQSNENAIDPSTTNLSIPSWSISEDHLHLRNKKRFVVYIVEVRIGGKSLDLNQRESGWVVGRRFSEFDALHKHLKTRFTQLMNLTGIELPAKRIFQLPTSAKLRPFSTAAASADPFNEEFLNQRRNGLEMYLRRLVSEPVICSSPEFRKFLSQDQFNVAGSSTSSSQPSPLFPRRLGDKLPLGNGVVFMKKLLANLSRDDSDSSLRPSSSTQSPKRRVHRQGSFPSMSILDILTQKLGNTDRGSSVGGDSDEELSSATLDRGINGSTSSLNSPHVMSVDGRPVTEQHVDKAHEIIQKDIAESLRVYIHHDVPSVPEVFVSSASTPTSPPTMVNKFWHDSLSRISLNSPSSASMNVATMNETVCDIFLEVFELKEKNNWLRKQAVVIILQQVFGGTIERKVHDYIKYFCGEEMVDWYLTRLHSTLMWYHNASEIPANVPLAVPLAPTHQRQSSSVDLSSGNFRATPSTLATFENANASIGSVKEHQRQLSASMASSTIYSQRSATSSSVRVDKFSRDRTSKKSDNSEEESLHEHAWHERTDEEKTQTKLAAYKKLMILLPDILGPMVGKSNVKNGSQSVFDVLQNHRLCQEVVYRLFDSLIVSLIPEVGDWVALKTGVRYRSMRVNK